MSSEREERNYHKIMTVLDYVDRGWKVLPIRGGQKIPAIKNWVNECTDDPEKAVDWWVDTNPSFNVGLATGHDFFVVDIDSKSENENGIASLYDFFESGNADVPDQVRSEFSVWMETLGEGCIPYARTANGGLHLLFKGTPDLTVKSVAGVLPYVDLRGAGGQIVCYPSVLRDEENNAWKKYEWCDVETVYNEDLGEDVPDISSIEIPDAPLWTLMLVDMANSSSTSSKSVNAISNRFNLGNTLKGIPEGARDQELNRLCWHLKGNNIHYDLALGVVLFAAQRCVPAFDEATAVEKLERAYSTRSLRRSDDALIEELRKEGGVFQ